MARRSLLSIPRSGVDSLFGAVTPGAGAEEAVADSGVGGVVVPLFAELEVEGWSFGFSLPDVYPLPVVGVGAALGRPTLFSSSFLRLCTSWPSSSNLASPLAFHPSNAFGTMVFKPVT